MSEPKTSDAIQFLDLLLDYFADGTRWNQGDLDDARGRRCLVGAIQHLRRIHQVSSGAVESLLQEALPPGYYHLASFNDRCAHIAELRALIRKARTRAVAIAEEERRRTAALRPERWWMRIGRKHDQASAGDAHLATEPELCGVRNRVDRAEQVSASGIGNRPAVALEILFAQRPVAAVIDQSDLPMQAAQAAEQRFVEFVAMA
jgi:hypothetical protein